MRYADPVHHQPRIEEKAKHRLRRCIDKNLSFDAGTLNVHRRPPFRSDASAASRSCARRSSQNAANSARSRATAWRLARYSRRVPSGRTKTRLLSRSTARCWDTAGRVIANFAAISPDVRSSRYTSARISRRVPSANARNTISMH